MNSTNQKMEMTQRRRQKRQNLIDENVSEHLSHLNRVLRLIGLKFELSSPLSEPEWVVSCL